MLHIEKLSDGLSLFKALGSEVRLEIVFPAFPDFISSVADGTIDVAECVLPRDIDQKAMATVKLADLAYHCLLSENHPLSQREALRPEDLCQAVGIRRLQHQIALQAAAAVGAAGAVEANPVLGPDRYRCAHAAASFTPRAL